MSSTKKTIKTLDIVLVGLFAAITLLGIQIFRIPLPAAIGSPFIHFGNAFVVLGILFLGGKKGAISGALGLGLFDVLNGYGLYALSTILSTLIVALVVSSVFKLFKRNDKNLGVIAISAAAGGLTNVLYDLIFGTITLLIAGSNLSAAFLVSASSILATAINAASTVIIVVLLYFPLKKGFEAIQRNRGTVKEQ